MFVPHLFSSQRVENDIYQDLEELREADAEALGMEVIDVDAELGRLIAKTGESSIRTCEYL
jgi:hypothetical protein